VDQREFPDPDPNLTVEQVREMMASFFPELANATHTEHQRGEDTIYEFQRRVGTKGQDQFLVFHFSQYDFWTQPVAATSLMDAIRKTERNECASYALPQEAALKLAKCINGGQPFQASLDYAW
jgi:PRTRC genetic system protein C